MKKISVVLALLMMMGFTGIATAATLVWGITPATDPDVGQSVTETLDHNATISADYGFGLFKGDFSHSYNFSSTDANPVLAYVIELLNENVFISSITLDGVAMVFDALTQRWSSLSTNDASKQFKDSLNATLFLHSIDIAGKTNEVGQQYLITASSVTSVSSIPIPAALWLFSPVIAGLISLARRKKDLALAALSA